jgi:hypothetical protein
LRIEPPVILEDDYGPASSCCFGCGRFPEKLDGETQSKVAIIAGGKRRRTTAVDLDAITNFSAPMWLIAIKFLLPFN